MRVRRGPPPSIDSAARRGRQLGLTIVPAGGALRPLQRGVGPDRVRAERPLECVQRAQGTAQSPAARRICSRVKYAPAV